MSKVVSNETSLKPPQTTTTATANSLKPPQVTANVVGTSEPLKPPQ